MIRIPKFIKRFIQNPIEAYIGKFEHRQRHYNSLKTIPSIPEALEFIQARWDMTLDDPKSPIFIFSTVWRSGSTLLQRLVFSGGDVLIWGEPYTYCDYIRKLAESLTCFRKDMPPDQFFIDHLEERKEKGIKTDKWIACLYPNPKDLIDAHRQFFCTLYEVPAVKRGYLRWGIKDVRLSIDHAVYLRFLFPNAKFLFLYRNPYKSYRSYRVFRNWYDQWPHNPIFTPQKFGEMWKILLTGYLEGYEKVGGHLIRYEDLINGNLSLSDLSKYLNTSLSDEIFSTSVTGRGDRTLESIPHVEMRILRSAVEPLASDLGYEPEP